MPAIEISDKQDQENGGKGTVEFGTYGQNAIQAMKGTFGSFEGRLY